MPPKLLFVKRTDEKTGQVFFAVFAVLYQNPIQVQLLAHVPYRKAGELQIQLGGTR